MAGDAHRRKGMVWMELLGLNGMGLVRMNGVCLNGRVWFG